MVSPHPHPHSSTTVLQLCRQRQASTRSPYTRQDKALQTVTTPTPSKPEWPKQISAGGLLVFVYIYIYFGLFYVFSPPYSAPCVIPQSGRRIGLRIFQEKSDHVTKLALPFGVQRIHLSTEVQKQQNVVQSGTRRASGYRRRGADTIRVYVV